MCQHIFSSITDVLMTAAEKQEDHKKTQLFWIKTVEKTMTTDILRQASSKGPMFQVTGDGSYLSSRSNEVI